MNIWIVVAGVCIFIISVFIFGFIVGREYEKDKQPPVASKNDRDDFSQFPPRRNH
jgi:hypothetical protein